MANGPEAHARAAALVAQAMERNPSSYEARKLVVRRLLLERKWEEALAAARQVNRRMPDDIEGYGLVVEANLGLGRMEEAERAAQWMLDLRPEDALSLWRAANVREAYGEWEGSLALLKDAYVRTHADRTLQRALILAHMARVSRRAGHSARAEKLAAEALRLGPASAEVAEILQPVEGEIRK
jgi:tetratricopeptide (TPR) repeat protein